MLRDQGLGREAQPVLARDDARRLHGNRLAGGARPRAEPADRRRSMRSRLPEEAANESAWVEQQVEVGALPDSHLIASAQPVRWRPGRATRRCSSGRRRRGPATGAPPGQRYTVWSYVPRRKPVAAREGGGLYPEAIERFLEPIPGGSEVTGVRHAEPRGRSCTSSSGDARELPARRRTEPLYASRREVVGERGHPYAAALALESWFRREGGFRYDEQPPAVSPNRAGRRSSRSSPTRRAATASTTRGRWRSCCGSSASRHGWLPASRRGTTTREEGVGRHRPQRARPGSRPTSRVSAGFRSTRRPDGAT